MSGNIVSSGAPLPCPYRALDSSLYSGAARNCALAPSLFNPRPVDQSPFTPGTRALRAAAPDGLAVTLRASGTQVTGFALTRVAAAPSGSGGRVRVQALNAGGAVLAEVGADPVALEADDAVATATLPLAAGIARVQVVVDGRVVARRDRGAPPTWPSPAT